MAAKGISIIVDDSDLKELEIKLPLALDRAVHRVALGHEAEWKRRARVETGSLRSSIHVDRKGVAQFEVADNVRNPEDGFPYGVAQELGTGIHAETFTGAPFGARAPITPKRARFMKFTWKGQEFYRMKVAGTPPSHAAHKALQSIGPLVDDIVARAIDTVLL